jgi:2-amino-4-hydroxy-6-hydroxymethyldihydropteridine diphosphokinase
MARAFVSIGSNISPEENVKKAVRLLRSEASVRAISTVYLTEPIGRPDQPSYYNCVVEIETGLPPLEFKHFVLKRIEDKLGRKRGKERYEARTIDLDLVLYDDITMQEEGLTLPDPDIPHRPFLAAALYELAPDLVLPDTKEPIRAIISAMRRDGLQPLAQYTEQLKKEILS